MCEHKKHRYFFTKKSLVTYQAEVYANSEWEARLEAYFGNVENEKIIDSRCEGNEQALKLLYTDDWNEETKQWVSNPKHVCTKCGSEVSFPEYQGNYWCKVDMSNPFGKIVFASDMSVYTEDAGAELCPECVQWFFDKLQEMWESTEEEEDDVIREETDKD